MEETLTNIVVMEAVVEERTEEEIEIDVTVVENVTMTDPHVTIIETVDVEDLEIDVNGLHVEVIVIMVEAVVETIAIIVDRVEEVQVLHVVQVEGVVSVLVEVSAMTPT
jgi:hypothetical protein